jgi:transposase
MMMKKVKYSNCEIARKLGVTEGAVRYRIKREASGSKDLRKEKVSVLDRFSLLIRDWIRSYEGDRRRPTLKLLYDILHERYGYNRSYDALRRYVRRHFPVFYKKGSWIRVETPAGHLLQVDWKEDLKIQMGEAGNLVTLHAMIFTLAFSRKTVVLYRESKDLQTFINCHRESFYRFGGLPMVIRTDCLKTAITRWNGTETVLNPDYSRYISRLGIEAFPSRPGTPTDKGKVEKRIKDLFSRLDFKHTVYKDLSDLQKYSDDKLQELEQEWRCGATGYSVSESFAYEQKQLGELPICFPQIPVKESRSRVRNDGTVFFCKNYYQVPIEYRSKDILCINTGSEVVLYHEGEVIDRFDYLPYSEGMVMLSEKVLRDPGLKISNRVRQWGLEVASRQVEIYHEISNGGLR